MTSGKLLAGEPLIAVRDLSIAFAGTTAVDGLSFTMKAGEVTALVGESGSGKTVTGLTIAGLAPPEARITGRVTLAGADILGSTPRQRRLAGHPALSMVFQDPQAALNPVLTIGDQIVEAVRADGRTGARAAAARALELLDLVRIPEPGRRFSEYPHRLSGGMRQRVVIALALAASPVALVADEPTTALDVTIQAQILQLLIRLKDELGMALLLITHDLGVVAETADRVLLMRDGRLLEDRGVRDFFDGPRHPYGRALLAARPGRRTRGEPRPRLADTSAPHLISGEGGGAC
ncbi:peptide/nickel transport system ATP-binding protein [Azospirillum brasilense]|uniref:Peptide/nickel transport system ATP-binding protein n=1 Tax=Azospirillum brasilense TaxID=192 RepID=A0A560AU76_AZOBR|nr:ABC transporter ATP-binding protein [Azospirillum brasilense]TWA63918.1 peptide/nickel transport system ATP-binding protein [Azospirillum brasilense]